MKSRRSFLKLVAAGSAAVLAGDAVAAGAAPGKPARKRSTPAPSTPAPSTASAAELRKQKESTAAALKAIRDYALPPGAAEPGFTFAPLVVAADARKERP